MAMHKMQVLTLANSSGQMRTFIVASDGHCRWWYAEVEEELPEQLAWIGPARSYEDLIRSLGSAHALAHGG